MSKILGVSRERFIISEIYAADELKMSLYIDFTLSDPLNN